MNATPEEGPRHRAPDLGFTLIEVVVSVVLIALVVAGVATFFVKGVASATSNERRLAAVALADQSMEVVRSIPAQAAAGVSSKLVQGRSKSEVEARWNGVSPYPAPPAEIVDSVPAWQTPVAPPGTPVLVPFEQEFTTGGEDYRVETFIGTCFRSSAVDDQCSPPPASGAEMFRVVIRVTWDRVGGRQCAGTDCQYLLSTLLDPNSDPLFNSNSSPVVPPAPVADNDSATTPMNVAVDIDVLNGDTGDLEASPVTVRNQPTNGALAGPPSNPVRYTPKAGFHGTDTFTYVILDKFGRTSNEATVTVTVVPPPAPQAVGDAVTVVAGQSATIEVLGNDVNAAGTTVTRTNLSSTGRGTLADLGTGRYWFDATAAGTVTFTYTLKDSLNRTSTATVTITVQLPAAPRAVNDAVQVRAGGVVDIDVLANDTYPRNVKVTADTLTPSGGGTLADLGSGQFQYTAPRSGARTATFSYTLRDTFDQTSKATVTITVTAVNPTAVNHTICRRGLVWTSATANPLVASSLQGIPGSLVTVVTPLPWGWSADVSADGTVTFGGPAWDTTVSYYLTDAYGQRSNTATITITRGAC